MGSIEPDTKDWTWVLQRTCPECGFDVTGFRRENVGAIIRELAEVWQKVLARRDVRARPSDDKWSPLEYACHVRDVFRLYNERLALMLTEVDPVFQNWDQDETAVAKRYGEQDPSTVEGELATAGATLAERFDGLREADWRRTGSRSDGASFTIESFARYFIHDPIHHLYDVEHPLTDLQERFAAD